MKETIWCFYDETGSLGEVIGKNPKTKMLVILPVDSSLYVEKSFSEVTLLIPVSNRHEIEQI